MKYLRIKLVVLIAFMINLVGVGIASAQTIDTKVASLVRQASKQCRTAKTLRRSDLEQAQSHFRQYVDILNQALELKPDLLENPDSNTQRVLDFCNNVKDDLDRAEALPLFEQGILECGEARILISNASFDEAREKERLYREYKDGALAISESVLDVYENSYEIRLCDKLEQVIAAAEAQYKEELRAAAAQTQAQNLFQPIVDSLAQSDRQCLGALNLINDSDRYSRQTVSQIENLTRDSVSIRKAALQERDKLLAQGRKPSKATSQRIDQALAGIRECQGSVPAGLKRVKQRLAALANKPNAGQDAGSKVAKAKVSSDVRQIVGAPARYPRRAISRGIEGYVIVSFTVTKAGDVTDVKVVESKPANVFDKAATTAVGKYKFQPRIKDDEPVDAKDIRKKVTFKLN